MIEIHDLLKLSSVPRIGHQKMRALISFFKSPEEIFRSSARDLTRVPGIDRKLASNIIHHTGGETYADSQIARLNKAGGKIVTFWDKEYPPILRKIFDPPAFIFILGNITEADARSIAIVGTRHPSRYGESVTENIVRELARHSITIVSGLARGVDTIAHLSALKNRTRTIAVIGSGLDVPYPPENRKLLERIAEAGAVISEFPMGSKPDAPNFPRRNRIISGISCGTVVTESAEDGGALITASTALDQNREVFAVPGNITEKRSEGTNRLIRDGHAKLVLSVQDIFDELMRQLDIPLGKSHRQDPPGLAPVEQSILKLLSDDPLHIDSISERAEILPSDALVALLSLEFKGIVRQLPGKLFVRL